MILTGGGTFDRAEENVYFIASHAKNLFLVEELHDHFLIAVNEIEGDSSVACLDQWSTDPRKRIFLDSGVFNLATSYADTHAISMDEALSMAPHEIDGFSDLFERYVSIVRSYGEKLWGYIEIDQGGRENKIKTRAKLEALGLRPIPVYHPLNDGWDYFDYLAERYDRICFGNIVQANSRTRLKLIATAWERHRKYPHLWVHFLGLTPNQWLNALPINSADSSSWLTPIRWPIFPSHCIGQPVGRMGKGYRYLLGKNGGKSDAENGLDKAVTLCGYKSHMDMLTCRKYIHDISAMGFEKYPALCEVIRHG